MAASLSIEEEQGTIAGCLYPHNGYYAGDFSSMYAATAAPAAPTRR